MDIRIFSVRMEPVPIRLHPAEHSLPVLVHDHSYVRIEAVRPMKRTAWRLSIAQRRLHIVALIAVVWKHARSVPLDVSVLPLLRSFVMMVNATLTVQKYAKIHQFGTVHRDEFDAGITLAELQKRFVLNEPVRPPCRSCARMVSVWRPRRTALQSAEILYCVCCLHSWEKTSPHTT